MAIAIIPARGGSKRLPKKNIKNFHGKPIIHYSIEAALKSELFDEVIVSTDSSEIAESAIKAGAHVPFLRPPELSDDFTALAPVFEHGITKMSKPSSNKEEACLILSTAPFVTSEHLRRSFEAFKKAKSDSLIPVTTFPFPILRSFKIENAKLNWSWPEFALKRSNDLPEFYHDAGQFYWVKTNSFLDKKQILTDNTVPFVLPRIMVQDIDTPEDWEVAETLFKLINNSNK